MRIFKLYYHICAFLKKKLFKVIYRRKIIFGKKMTFRANFSLMIAANGKVVIGNNCFFNNNCSINCRNYIEIGSGTIIGENVKLYDHNHEFRNIQKRIKEQGYNEAPIKIGNNCWIGSNVTILKGVTIGDNVVIGAHSLIYQDIPDKSIVRYKCELIIENYDESVN